jgi:hypothetical protein
MTSNRLQTGLAGLALAATAGSLVLVGGDLAATALLGVALGGVVALVPDRSVLGRVSGFLVGLLAAWVGYALRAGVLPDIALGRAIAVVGVVGIVTVAAVASAGRLPLWSGLLGAAAMAGAYESVFATSPTSFVLDSTTAVTTTLVAVSFGLLLASLAPVSRTAIARPEVYLPSPRSSVDARVEQEVSR